MTAPDDADRLLWRIAPGVTASLFVLAAILFAIALYVHPGLAATIVVAVLGLAAAGAGAFAARQLLYADRNRLILRWLTGSREFDWSEIAAVDVVPKGKTGMTLCLRMADGSIVHVPPSLVLPSTPKSIGATHSLLNGKATELSRIGGLLRSS